MKYLSLLLYFFLFPKYSSQILKLSEKPLSERKIDSSKTGLTSLLNEKNWNELFPNRSDLKNSKDFYSFKSFVKASKYFPEFLSDNDEIKKRELAAFLANIAQETSGGWPEAPGGYFKWGLYFVDEQQTGLQNDYADFSKLNYPPVDGKKYFGRGPKQLSWNYNYGQFSEAWFGSKDILLKNPDLLSEDPVLSFASAIWFWMTPQFPKPSCHEIMTGKWTPSDNDILNGRLAGFGSTVNVINGGIECGNGKDLEKTKYRYDYYRYFCDYFKVSPGDNISCATQKPFGQ
ncbi:chitinase [Halpernia frigidisoli]|uniref:Chitinase GH19 n=1 Tax=Halpernia frigidisoli TaxID=1125876 RepID=A0A1I3E8E9_9FLAO|nr:chitinase [Halpernia frigidisoli]SFH95123.1 chitinase GH19 [Halpernia frigidisoli]